MTGWQSQHINCKVRLVKISSIVFTVLYLSKYFLTMHRDGSLIAMRPEENIWDFHQCAALSTVWIWRVELYHLEPICMFMINAKTCVTMFFDFYASVVKRPTLDTVSGGILCRGRRSTEAAALPTCCSRYTSCVDGVFKSSKVRFFSPHEGSSLAQHPGTKALPFSLVDPHLLGGVQTRQHCSPLPGYQPRVHVLKCVKVNIQYIKGAVCFYSLLSEAITITALRIVEWVELGWQRPCAEFKTCSNMAAPPLWGL